MGIGQWRLRHTCMQQQPAFCFLTTEKGNEQDICKLTTTPCVQRSLYLNGRTDDFGNLKVKVPKGVGGRTRNVLEQCMTACWKTAGVKAQRRSRARKEASAREVRGYYKQFAEAKHQEYKSWVDNEVFDLVHLTKVKPRNHVTRIWVLSIKSDKKGNFLKAKAKWALRGFQDKQKEYPQTDSPASTRPGFRTSCQMAASKSWNIFHIDLKTAFLHGKSTSLYCRKIEETCKWYEWCSSTLVEHSGQGTVKWWHDSNASWPMLLFVVLNPNTVEWANLEPNVFYTVARD